MIVITFDMVTFFVVSIDVVIVIAVVLVIVIDVAISIVIDRDNDNDNCNDNDNDSDNGISESKSESTSWLLQTFAPPSFPRLLTGGSEATTSSMVTKSASLFFLPSIPLEVRAKIVARMPATATWSTRFWALKYRYSFVVVNGIVVVVAIVIVAVGVIAIAG